VRELDAHRAGHIVQDNSLIVVLDLWIGDAPPLQPNDARLTRQDGSDVVVGRHNGFGASQTGTASWVTGNKFNLEILWIENQPPGTGKIVGNFLISRREFRC
jgi:hypothetical protein